MLQYILDGKVRWDLKFRRALQSWEGEDLEKFLALLTSASPVRDGRIDCVGWRGSGCFAVYDAYQWWMSKYNLELEHWKSIWNPLAPFRVQCFF